MHISEFIIKHRLVILIVLVIITGFFAFQMLDVKMRTSFDDLLPANHPFILLHKGIRNIFGGANIVTIVVKVQKGDIFNYETLSKVKRLTETAQQLPFVNNYQIISLASRKVKDVRSIPGGIKVSSMMYPNIPESKTALQELKRNVTSNDFIYGSLVSIDFKAALLSLDFYEEGLDYKVLFKKIKEMCDRERDDKHEIYMVGTPILYGWVYHSFPQILTIFGLTGVAILLLIILFTMGNLRAIFLPILCAVVSGIWGVGLLSMLSGYALDPLLLVIPFLISSYAISHGFQVSSRFFEEESKSKDRKKAAVVTVRSLWLPCIVSLITDIAGAFVLIITPMPILQKLAILASFWIFSILISAIILGPIVLSYLPVREIKDDKNRKNLKVAGRFNKLIDSIMMIFAALPFKKKASWTVLVLLAMILSGSMYFSTRLQIGDVSPGSPILWPNSIYNKDFAEVNKTFLASEPLYIIVKGDKTDAFKKPDIVNKVEEFQRHMETEQAVGYSVSAVDIIRKINMVLYGDNPKREVIPDTWDGIGYLYYTYISQGEPGDFERFVDFEYKDANIQIFCLDHRGETISRLLEKAKTFIEQNPMEGARFEMAAGLLGILGAANQEIAKTQIITTILIFSFVIIFCWISFRSFVAAFILIIPLFFSNFLTSTFMVFRGIGLNVNILPVASLGVGMGVDFGIYILSRIKEEYERCGDLETAIQTALLTSGRAVLATGFTIVTSVILWTWAPLRFLAEMGMLLAIWMGIVAIIAMILVPLLVVLIKPRFILKSFNSGNS